MAHSRDEPRFLRLGRAATGRVLILGLYREEARHGETIRIISARQASRRERVAYAAPPAD